MLFFIPAWYSKNEWKENEQVWYVNRSKTEFDDSVKQIQLFHRNRAYPYCILLLSYAPNLRHFLHRQSVMRAVYWSCFDSIQCVRRKKTWIMSFHDLKWPSGIEFKYTPFAVVAFFEGKKYAQIEFSEDGNMISVAMYKDGELVRTNVYDDRGFISSTIVWSDGKVEYEKYLDENGRWKINSYPDGHVEVNPQNNKYIISFLDEPEKEYEFSKLSYDSMEEVIMEVFNTYIDCTSKKDVFCVAMHSRHSKVINDVLDGRKKILSFFKGRIDVEHDSYAKKLLDESEEIVVDISDTKKRIESESGKTYPNITEITPFDTRVDFGISQSMNVQNILVPIDDLSDSKFKDLIQQLADYLPKNEYARVNLFTRKAQYDSGRGILKRVQAILEENGYNPGWARKEENHCAEFALDEEDTLPILFQVEQGVDELSVSKCMRKQRVVVDMADVPDLFLQISCISMGIPQINREQTRYLEPDKNGKLCQDMNSAVKAVSYYLDSMPNWNKAKVSAYEIGKRYTTARLSSQWREVINRVEQN